MTLHNMTARDQVQSKVIFVTSSLTVSVNWFGGKVYVWDLSDGSLMNGANLYPLKDEKKMRFIHDVVIDDSGNAFFRIEERVMVKDTNKLHKETYDFTDQLRTVEVSSFISVS